MHFFFSKFKKYLLFFSPNSYQHAEPRTIAPWVFRAIIFASLLFTRSISAFVSSLKCDLIFSCNSLNSCVNFFSSSRCCNAFLFGKAIVAALISIPIEALYQLHRDTLKRIKVFLLLLSQRFFVNQKRIIKFPKAWTSISFFLTVS